MTGWLPRGLVVTAIGAVLAFAVTVQVAHVDIATAGAIIMFAGIGYLLVHFALLGWERGWGQPHGDPYGGDGYDGRAGSDRYDGSRRAAAPRPAQVEYHRADDGYRQAQAYRPGGYVSGYGERGQSSSYRPDPDDTQVMPVVRDDTTAGQRRPRR